MADAQTESGVSQYEQSAESETVRKLEAKIQDLKALVRVSAVISSTLNLRELLELIMKSAEEVAHAESSSLMLLDEDAKELVFEVATGEKGQEVSRLSVPLGSGIAGHVAQTGEIVVVNDVSKDPRFYSQIDKTVGFQTRSLLCVPLKARDKIIGVLEVVNKSGEETFTDDDVELCTALAGQASIAIDNARLYQELADALVTSRLSYRL
jgi:GAF domain-containing protein